MKSRLLISATILAATIGLIALAASPLETESARILMGALAGGVAGLIICIIWTI